MSILTFFLKNKEYNPREYNGFSVGEGIYINYNDFLSFSDIKTSLKDPGSCTLMVSTKVKKWRKINPKLQEE